MHRMRHYIALAGFVLIVLGLVAPSAEASLLKPDAGRSYPDISADVNGSLSYTYDPSSQTGVFQLQNSPFVIAGGPGETGNSQEYNIVPDPTTGVRSQTLTLTLDKNGQIVTSSPNSSYQLYGSVTADGHTYSGLLLSGTPTGFGSIDLGPNVQSDMFDVTLQITGGLLAQYYGDEAYMRITPEINSTFTGSFTENFAGVKAMSNTRSYESPLPFPIPEPTVLTIVLVGAGGLAYRHRGRLRKL
jgi:hypothetical protein